MKRNTRLKGPEEEDKMKNLKKALAFLLTAAMTMAMGMTSFADETETPAAGTAKTITITSPSEVGDGNEITYEIYKVFDATNDGTTANISYKLLPDAGTAPDGFIVDDAGNVYLGELTPWTEEGTKPDGAILISVKGEKTYLTPQGGELNSTQIDAIKKYAKKVRVGEVKIQGANKSKTIQVEDYGYYYITTTSGALVTINSTNPAADVTDKNSITTVVKSAGTEYDKNAMEAIAAVGSSQPFTAQITVGKGAKKVVFTDTMENMIFDATEGKGLKITASSKDADGNETAVTVSKNDYAVAHKTPSEFEVEFTDEFISKLPANTVITLKYFGIVTSDALSVNPAKNTAKVTTGENGENTSTSEEVKVYNAKFTITKTDGNNQPLAGAGFVIKNADGKYYKLHKAQEAKAAVGTEGEEGYVPAQAASDAYIEWIAQIDDATEYTSDAAGNVPAFTGLADGTYTRIEKTVPAGYNKAADANFTISGNDYTAENLEQTETVVNNAGAVLPSTGGMGTTLFYTLGTLLVVGAGVLMVTRRRMELN